MQIKVNFGEICLFIKKRLDKDVKIKYVNPSTVLIDFIINVELSIKSLEANTIKIGYSMNSFAEMMAKSQIKAAFESVDPNVGTLDMNNKEITINIANIPQMQKFIENFIISSAGFDATGLNIELSVK